MQEKNVSVNFYIDGIRYCCTLEEVNRNLQNGQLSGSLFGRKNDMIFPFLTAENGIFREKEKPGHYEIISFTHDPEELEVRHGNLFQVNDIRKKQGYYIFFQERDYMDIQFDRFELPVYEKIRVGRSSSNHIQYQVSDVVPRDSQLILQKHENGMIHLEVSEKTGFLVYVNGKKYQNNELRTGDEVQYLGLTILCLNGGIAVSRQDVICHGMHTMKSEKIQREEHQEAKQFNRTFRLSDHPVRRSAFEIELPPSLKEEEQIPLILSIGPSFTMAMAMMISAGVSVSNALKGGNSAAVITGCSMAVCMFLAAAFWPVLLRKNRKKRLRAYNKAREEKYRQYISNKEEEIIAQEEYNRKILDEYSYPSPEVQISFLLDNRIHRLWERSRTDQDFLDIRLGKGVIQNLSHIKIPAEKFSMQSDPLMKLPQEMAVRRKMLSDVPITIALKENHRVGLVGAQNEIISLIQLILLNLISLHAPEDVKIAFVGAEEKLKKVSWIEKIPHIWNWSHNRRLIAVNSEESAEIYREVYGNRRPDGENFVIFVTDPEYISSLQWKQMISRKEDAKVSFLFAYGNYYELPQSCNLLVQWGKDECFIQKKDAQIRIQKDVFPEENIDKFVSELSRLSVNSGMEGKVIPDSITYFQMYKVGNVKELEIEKRWKASDAYNSLAVPVGIGPDGEVINLDIHERFHGSHGLVAGMTGAGKSEFLQAYITSLMIQFSPEDISFVLIDFKGGDMARPYKESPYLAASISNLSENILRRAVISLRAEIHDRELRFNSAAQELGTGKMDINLYIKYHNEGKVSKAIPHLFIIVDEFAQLKKQNAAFLDELVNIAQVGRSIGIHLILATQKPSGIVDGQISSNSRFRICLKVQSRQDSSDMIEGPEAADIRQPGRFYMMVGNRELFLEAQSGYAGCTCIESDHFYEEDNRKVAMVDHTGVMRREMADMSGLRRIDMTQMEAVLREIEKIAGRRKMSADALWKPELKEILYADKEPVRKNAEQYGLPVPVGMGDFVKDREQKTIYSDLLRTGHVAVLGLAGSGKTTLVQTILWGMAYRYSPEEWNLYYLDLSGKSSEYYKNMPHCRQVLFGESSDEIAALLEHLEEHMEERKCLFAEEGCNTYKEYISNPKNQLPALVLVVDNYSPFRDQYYRLEEKLVRLISNGKTYGICMIITGNSKSAVYQKVMEQVGQLFLLQLNEKSAYQIILGAGSDIITPAPVNGRGICKTSQGIVEFQTYLMSREDSEVQRRLSLIREISQLYSTVSEEKVLKKTVVCKTKTIRDTAKNQHERSELVRIVHNRNTVSIQKPEILHDEEGNLTVGYSLSGKLKYGISLKNPGHFLIAGEKGEQKLQWVLILMEHLNNFGGVLSAVADFGKKLKPYQVYFSEFRWLDEEASFDTWLENVYRLWKKGEKGIGNYVLFVSDFRDFFNGISNKAADWLREICRDQGQTLLHVITVAVINQSLSMYNVDELYEYFIKTESGLLCDGMIEKGMYMYLNTQMKNIILAYAGKRYSGEKALFFHNGKAVEVKVR